MVTVLQLISYCCIGKISNLRLNCDTRTLCKHRPKRVLQHWASIRLAIDAEDRLTAWVQVVL